MARSILTAIWHILKYKVPYRSLDTEQDWEKQLKESGGVGKEKAAVEEPHLAHKDMGRGQSPC